MAIADTITSMQTHTSNAYSMIGYGTDLTGTNKNLENLSKSIFKAYIESLNNPNTLWGNLPKITGTGTNISLNNTIEAPMRIELSPVELSQDGTPTPSSPQAVHTISGDNTIYVCNKNLAWKGWVEDFVTRINSTGAILETYDNRNCLRFSPAAGYGDYDNKYMLKIKGGFKENTRYSFKYDYYAISEWGNMNITYTDDTTQEIRAMKSNTWNNVFVTSQANKTIKYLRVQWRDNQPVYLDLDTFMVYEGTENATYVANDGTDYSIDLGVENLLKNNLASGTTNGITYIVNEDKSVTLSGTATAITWLVLNNNVSLPAGTYTMSQKYIGNDIRMYSTGLGVYTLDGERTVTKSTDISGDVSINIPNGTVISTPITIYPMIEKGSTAHPYTEYGKAINYCKIGNYEDRIFKNISSDTDYSNTREDGAWYIKKNIGKVVLDGTETINTYTYNGMNGVNFNNVLSVAGTRMTGMCNYSSKVGSYFSSNSIWLGVGDRFIYWIGILDELGLSQVSEFETWLSTHNTIVYYQLATPTYTKIEGTLAEQLEAIWKAQSKDGQTNISQINNDLAFGLSATLIEDLT